MIKLTRKICCLALFISICIFPLRANESPTFTVEKTCFETNVQDFRHLTVNDGFARSAVLNILQSKEGLMWFGTWDGLYTFDGYKLKLICRPKNSKTATNEVIQGMVEDNQHRIWMAISSGIAIWDIIHKQLSYLNLKTTDGKDICEHIQHLTKDNYENIWITTLTNKLFLYINETQSIKNVTHITKRINAPINNVCADNKGNLWIATANKGVFKIEQKSPNIDTWQATRDAYFDAFNNSCTNYIYQDSQNAYWLSSAAHIYKIDHKNISEKSVIRKFELPSNINADNISIFNFAEKNNTVYAATSQGLFKYSIKKDIATWIRPEYNQKNSLNDKNVRHVMIDREGGLWIATFYGGVNYLSPTTGNFSSYTHINNKIEAHVISGIAEDNEHKLWVSTEDGGICHWDRTCNEIRCYKSTNSSGLRPTKDNIQSLYIDGNTLYLGMYEGGMDIIDIPTLTKKNYNSYNTVPDKLPNNIYSFLKIDDEKMLLGTLKGLYLFNTKTQQVNHIKGTFGKIQSIIQDDEKDIWVSSKYDGIYLLSKDLKKFYNFVHDEKDKNSLISNNITTLASFGSTIYIGTSNKGLWTYHKTSKKFKPFADNSLNDAVIYKIIIDKDNLWITTNKGLHNYNTITQQTKVYTSLDGLSSNQFKVNSGIQTSDNTIVLGTVNGITSFNPKELMFNEVRPSVILTAFYLFNKSVDINDKDCPLKESITFADKIELNQKHNNFTFKFASSSYNNPSKNIYKYKLEPFEKEWQETAEGNNAASYTNLPAGNYTFHVQTSNGEGLWSNDKQISLIIHPYWWASLPMKFLYFIIVLSLFTLIIHRYLKKKKEEIYLLRLEKEKEVYHSKMEFFTFMVHEIRTPLTLILGPLSDIMEKKSTIEEALPELNTIKRNGNRLLSLVNQLMDFRKVEEKSYVVQMGIIDLKELIQQVSQNFQYNCNQKHITFEIDLPETECLAKADREAMTKIITNLLSNASKFTKNEIKVGLTLSNDKKYWSITIQDNGKGIEAQHQSDIFKSFYQVREDLPNDYIGTGVGLSVVKQLLELQGGNIFVKSTIGKGACFIANIQAAEAVLENGKEVSLMNNTLENKNISNESKKKRLLVAEDNEDMRNYIISIFSKDYEIDACENGQEALNLTTEHTYDLILTDLMMPVMDGFALSKILKQQESTSHIPIIILTAKDDESSQIEGFTAKADAYVIKPFSAKVLSKQVESIIINREKSHKKFFSEPDSTTEELCTNTQDKIFLEKLDELINSRLTETLISVDELAQELAMGRTSFYQKVKGLTGLTPNDYIRTIRLKKAAAMLKNGEKRINEVFYLVGFSSSSYFAKRFTAQFGISPSDYVKKKGNI